MDSIATLRFHDHLSDDEACFIVRKGEGSVALCISIRGDGDLEVSLSADDTRRLVSALNQALGV